MYEFDRERCKKIARYRVRSRQIVRKEFQSEDVPAKSQEFQEKFQKTF
jgi:hypothetical protein